jgi:excisionase family DNA binding protein
MSERGPGRPREHGEGDWLTIQQAADRLGVTYQAIYQRIQRGTIAYDEWIEEGERRPHLRIPLSAIDGNVESKELDQRNADRTMRIEGVLSDGLKQVLENQEKLMRQLAIATENQEAATEIMREQANTEKAFQERIISFIENQAEKQHELQKEGIKERRSFWSKIFWPE